jgi:hypothetical protein
MALGELLTLTHEIPEGVSSAFSSFMNKLDHACIHVADVGC